MTSQDFTKRIDLTGLTTVTGSEMNQLIDAATVADDKGLRIITTDTALGIPNVPDPNQGILEGVDVSHWKRYEWVRLPYPGSGGKVIVYNWNEELTFGDASPTLRWEILYDYNAVAGSISLLDAQIITINGSLAGIQAIALNAQDLAQTANDAATNALTAANEALNKANTNSDAIAGLQEDVAALQTNSTPGVLPISEGGTGATNVSDTLSKLGIKNTPRFTAFLREVQTAGVNGGTFTQAIQTKRTLNILDLTSTTYAGYCTLNGDSTFTLIKGIWLVEAEVPAFYVGTHKASLYSNTDNTVLLTGSSEFTNNPTQAVTKSKISGVISLLATKALQINHICGTTQAVNGLGVAANLGLQEIYTQVKLTYLGDI